MRLSSLFTEMKSLLISSCVLILVLQPQCNSSPIADCSTRPSSDMKISVSSSRNQTGNWFSQVIQVTLEHGENGNQAENSDQAEKGNRIVDLEITPKNCDSSQTNELNTTIPGSPPKAPAGYDFFPDMGYYKFHKDGQTWDRARQICEQEGAYLAVINSDAESHVIQTYLAKNPKLENVQHNDFAFIGFHDRFIEGEYITVQGKSLGSTGFTRWAGPNQPDNAGFNENCGSVHRNGGLNDIPCDWKLTYFCEQAL